MVVKVLHADIEKKVAVDMDILAGLAQMAEMVPEFRNYRPAAIVAEYQRTMRRELDFGREERNIQQFAHDFHDDPTVHFPRTYPDLSTRRVLTMELLDGIKLSESERLTAAAIDPDEVARRGAAICLKMIFDHGFYHADPHPGNLLVMDQCRIGLLDFGMVGRIDERLHEAVSEMLVALSDLDAEHMTTMIVRLGKTPADLDRAALSLDVADFLSYYASQSLDKFDLSGALNEMMEQIRRYHIMLPARIVMLLKALVTLEGTARLVSPKFNLVEMIRPYRQEDALAAVLAAAAAPQAPSAVFRTGTPGRHPPPGNRRHPRTDAGREVRHPSRPSRPGAFGEPAGAGAAGQRAVRRLVAAAEPHRAAGDRSAAAAAEGLGAGRGGRRGEHRPGAAALAGDQQVGPS